MGYQRMIYANAKASVVAMGIVLSALVLSPTPASALCVNGGTGSVTVADSPAGQQNIGSNANCTVDAGGSISTVNILTDGILATDNNTITNNGRISTTNDFSAGILAFDSNTIMSDGTILTFGDFSPGIQVDDNNSITINGHVSTTGFASAGVDALDNNTIINNGNISTTNDFAGGIFAFDSNTIIGDGTISTFGDFAPGIQVDDNNSITINGRVSTTGFASVGIDAFDNNTITNNGSLSTSGDDANAIDANDGNVITNHGVVRTTGDRSDGLNANDNSTIVNTGTVSVSGVLSDAVDVDNNSTVINSGLLRSIRDNAIEFDGTNNNLVLLPGSIIIGGLEVDEPGNTLTVSRGLSLIYTFTDNVPTTINTFGAPIAVNGLRVAVLDSTVQAQRDEVLADLTNGIFNSVHARLNGAGGRAANGFSGIQADMAPIMQLGGGTRMNLATSDVTPGSTNTTSGFWAQAFGGVGDEDATALTPGFEHELVGGIAGVDGMIMPGIRLGAFGGAAHANLETDLETAKFVSDSHFVGFYASTNRNGWFAHVMLTAGQSDFDNSRDVLNNLVSTGTQTARANYDGTFISPEFTVGTASSLDVGFTIEPSVRARFAYLSVDGYSESGAADGLRVGDQKISLWQGRAQLAFVYTSETGRFAPRIGIEGRTSDNDAISAVLIGQAISFNPGGDDDEISGFIGATATSYFGRSVSAFVDGEIHRDDDGLARVETRAGVTVAF
ncbi:MAG: autotransporter domain-containing protein [Hyphomicrobiaceae bacterium]